MRIVFMGTPDFAVPTLKTLIDSEHTLAAVVTQPDRPRGRGGRLAASPVKEVAVAAGIPVLQPEKVRAPEVLEQLRKLQPDVIVVVAFGQILPKEILELPRYGCMNVHASLLPRLRGAAPIQWSVIQGDEYSGVTVMQMDEGLDTGDILLVKKYKLAPDETGGSLFDKLSMLGGPLILEALQAALEGRLKPIPQTEEEHTYAKMLTKATGKIDFTQSAVAIERLIRGLNPWPKAYTFRKGKMVTLWQAQVVEAEQVAVDEEAGAWSSGAGEPEMRAAELENTVPENEKTKSRLQREESVKKAKPGTVTAVDKDSFVVQTGKGGLRILSLQLEGKKRMSAGDFLRGNAIRIGDIFGE